jgi:negative regulator of sigma E activity
MSDTLHEQLSAFLDGELPPEETDLLLKRLARDPELRATLGRYGLVGDTLRGERSRASAGFALRVRSALEQEPALQPRPAAPPAAASVRTPPAARGGVPRWLKPAAGFAVAATVAGLAVLVLQRDPSLQAPGAAPAAQVADAGAAPAARVAPAPAAVPSNGEPASYVTPPAGRPAVAPIPPAQLANYVVAHSEYSSPMGRRNVLTGLIADEAVVVVPEPAPPPAGAAPATVEAR